MKKYFRGLIVTAGFLVAAVLLGAILALNSEVRELLLGAAGAPAAPVNFAVIDALPKVGQPDLSAAPPTAAPIKSVEIVLATVTPTPTAAPPIFSAEMGEACRQAAVNGRRSSPRCRGYFVWWRVGR